MGTWASAVTTAVAPLCWESKTFLTTVSGSDTITQLPHQGYLIRTQPNTHLQIGKLGEFLVSLKVKRVFTLAAQTPFAVPSQKRLAEILQLMALLLELGLARAIGVLFGGVGAHRSL
jgi:branched-chain amino acid transport system substrate-binding protein